MYMWYSLKHRLLSLGRKSKQCPLLTSNSNSVHFENFIKLNRITILISIKAKQYFETELFLQDTRIQIRDDPFFLLNSKKCKSNGVDPYFKIDSYRERATESSMINS